MEFVLAVLARHSWEAFVGWVKHAVADHAVFYTFDLSIDVALPKEYGRDDISVSQLKQVFDRQDPLILLPLRDFELLADLNNYRFHRVVGWNHELQLHGHLSLCVFCDELFRGFEEREGEALPLATLF